MKAVTCSQCGALVKKISLREKFAFCDYCGAKIILSENKDKIIEIPDMKGEVEEKKLTPWEQHQENYRKMRERVHAINPEPVSYPQSETNIVVVLALVGLAILLIALASSKGCLYRPLDDKPNVSNTEDSREIRNSTLTPTPTPIPKIKYESRVEWDGMYLNYDMEHYESPKIEIANLPTFNETELKKTVFKVRNVQVKITINTDGEVSSAEAITGHQILRDAAVKAAQKTLFEPRQKPTNRTLTYYFRLVSE